MSFDNGRVREWIGPRIVPVFADVVEWDITSTYEPLVMVQHAGETFMTRQYVPAGIQLPDTAGSEESNDYWVHMSNWNAQVEYYRQEVLAFDGRIDALEDALPIADFDSTHTIDGRFDTIEANGWVGTDRIADSAVTSAKIADGTIATADIADGAITSDKIANGTIVAADLANGAVTTEKIADGTIKNADFATKHMIVIGDSFSLSTYTDGNLWHKIVGEYLDLTVKNYAVNGAGYVTGTTFQTQLANAIDDTSYDHDQVEYVFVLGCINDGSSDIETAGHTLIASIKTAYPKAKIIVGTNAGINQIKSISNRSVRAKVAEITRGQGVLFANTAAIAVFDGALKSDNIHPTAFGSRVLATVMLNTIFGGSIPYQSIDSRVLNSVSGIEESLYYGNGFVQGSAIITTSSVTTSNGLPLYLGYGIPIISASGWNGFGTQSSSQTLEAHPASSTTSYIKYPAYYVY